MQLRYDPGTGPFLVLKGPIPALRVNLISRISELPTGPAAGKQPLLLLLRSRAEIQGVPIPEVVDEAGLTFGQQVGFLNHHEVKWQIRLPRYVINAIESVRHDNVQLTLTTEIGYWDPVQPTPPQGPFGWTNAQFTEKIPQSEWLRLLEELGYSGGWVVEVPRPSVEGMAEAVRFLGEAWEKIDRRDAPGAVSDCRKAWDSVDSIVKGRSATISSEIDGLSKGEPNRDTKSKRVEEIRRWTDSFVQIGPHSDVYEVTMDDALLAYRLTTSLMSYVGRKVVQAETRKA
jgi:hypothetical protein